MTTFADSLEEWLDAVASDAPEPGGGAVAALVGGLAAALVSMVGRFTVGRPKYAAVEDDAEAALAASEVLRAELSGLVAEDAAAFRAVAAAYRLPKATPAERAARVAAIQAALPGATEAPLRVMEAARAVLGLAATLAEIGNRAVRSDAGAAALLAAAALRAASLSVRENLAAMTDHDQRDALAARLAAALDDVDSLVTATVARVTPAL